MGEGSGEARGGDAGAGRDAGSCGGGESAARRGRSAGCDAVDLRALGTGAAVGGEDRRSRGPDHGGGSRGEDDAQPWLGVVFDDASAQDFAGRMIIILRIKQIKRR